MLYYILFWTLLGFVIHFYIIFGTNLLTVGPARIAVVCLFQCYEEKEHQTESKRNETFGRVIFGTEAIQETWSKCQVSFEVATRVGTPPTWLAPLSRGPLEHPPTDFFHLYKSMYPKNVKDKYRSGGPPPQASIATKNQLGPYSGTLPEGGSLTGGHLHHPGALHDEEGVVHLRG